MAEKLRIGLILQGNPSWGSWMGGIEYFKNLIKALYALPDDLQGRFELVPLAIRRIEDHYYADMPPRFQRELRQEAKPPPQPPWKRLGVRLAPWLFGSKPSLLQKAKSLGIHFLYPYLPSPKGPWRVATAAWIPDLQYKHLPQFFSREEIQNRERSLTAIANHSPWVVLSSQASANDFRRFFPGASAKVQVMPFCTTATDDWYTQDPEAIACKHKVPDRFFLVCNQFWQHKNHKVVFEAMQVLRQQGIRPSLVCTGAVEDYRRPGYAQEVRRMLEDLQIQDQVHLVGLLPRLEQIQLMRRALAVIQPSLFEGWSTVVEDCRVLAKTLALSDLPVHREQNPPRAYFFSPHSPHQLAEILAPWWSQLKPGPDWDGEQQALLQNRRDLENFGRQFLFIAHQASQAI
jgi:glycosyltransferase involved in cell wall biosynthesis